MKPRSPIYIIAFDACDPATAQIFAKAGYLPSFHRMFERAGRCRVRNPMGLFVGGVWISFATGLRPDRHGFHCWDEIDVASYERQLTRPGTDYITFWERLSDSGRRVAVIDVPHANAAKPVNGIQIAEWGCHDRHFGFHTWPNSLAADIDSSFGLHPIFGLDAYADKQFAPDDYAHRAGPARTADEDRALLEGLDGGLAGKRRIVAELLAEKDWDLFLTVFGESHGIGHQQWHYHDAAHPLFDRAAVEALGGDPILRIYRNLDAALGEMLSRIGDGTILLLLSHGMGPHYDGAHLLDEILARIDRFDRGPMEVTRTSHLLRRGLRSLPTPVQRYVTAFAVPAIRRRAAERNLQPCREFITAEERARQRFFLEPNNFAYGGVRLNLVGREPHGCVHPDEVESVYAELSRDLLSLVNVETGNPVVSSIERSDRYYRRSPEDTLPDLFIEWDRSGLIETVWSPKTGIVHAPYANWRTGDHRPDGLLLAMGAGIPTGTTLSAIDVEDIGPSVSARLGLRLDDVDGSVIPWLAGHA